MKNVKADLHMHPHFFTPADMKNLRSGAKGVPRLREIVDTLMRKGIEISSLTACHPKPGDIDYRFLDYMSQLPELTGDFRNEYYEAEGWVYLERRQPIQDQQNSLIILNSQQVRTDYNGLPADINVIGVKQIIPPGQDIDQTSDQALEMGGIVTVSNATSHCGAGLEKGLEMLETGKAHAIEVNAIGSRKLNGQLMVDLLARGKLGLPVSDAHHVEHAGASYAMFDRALLYKFSIKKLGTAIRDEQYDTQYGDISAWGKFITHRLPIARSLLDHWINNREYIRKALAKRKQ